MVFIKFSFLKNEQRNFFFLNNIHMCERERGVYVCLTEREREREREREGGGGGVEVKNIFSHIA